MRLIDADALIGELHTQFFYDGRDRTRVYARIQEQPTIEPKRGITKGEYFNLMGFHTSAPAFDRNEPLDAEFVKDLKEIENTIAEPKHGRWDNEVIYSDNKVALWCSECGKQFFKLPTENGEYNYCPNCGCKMDEVEE